MKKLSLFLCITGITLSCAQDENRKVQEVSYLKAKAGFDQEFESSVENHIKSYDKDENTADIRKVTQGYRSGESLWINGPMKMSFMDQKNKRREDDWHKNILSKAELKASNLYSNHPAYRSMSQIESGSGEVVLVRVFI